jgi:opacity protein-like surface antigen
LLGVTAGAGFEYRLTNNWLLRGEYMFMSFNPVETATKVINITTGLGTGNTFIHNAVFYENVVRGAVSYKF